MPCPGYTLEDYQGEHPYPTPHTPQPGGTQGGSTLLRAFTPLAHAKYSFAACTTFTLTS